MKNAMQMMFIRERRESVIRVMHRTMTTMVNMEQIALSAIHLLIGNLQLLTITAPNFRLLTGTPGRLASNVIRTECIRVLQRVVLPAMEILRSMLVRSVGIVRNVILHRPGFPPALSYRTRNPRQMMRAVAFNMEGHPVVRAIHPRCIRQHAFPAMKGIILMMEMGAEKMKKMIKEWEEQVAQICITCSSRVYFFFEVSGGNSRGSNIPQRLAPR